MIHHVKFFVKAALLSALVTNSHAQTVDKKALTLDGANRVIAAAIAEAKRLNAPGAAIAVVDDGGNLVAVERLDNTFAAGANISIGKARTAALFKKPTKVFEGIVNKGRTTMVALPDFTPLQGGVPIVVDGSVIGGVGVSGASSAQQDEDLAIAAAKAVASTDAAANAEKSAAPVAFIGSTEVAAAFARGRPLQETGEYKVHASRRTEPGLVEIHADETDTIFVLEGSATFVTGGKVVGSKAVAPGEIRGTDVVGGDVHRLAKGDVIVVPRGVPHWFKEVRGTFFITSSRSSPPIPGLTPSPLSVLTHNTARARRIPQTQRPRESMEVQNETAFLSGSRHRCHRSAESKTVQARRRLSVHRRAGVDQGRQRRP